MKEINRQKHTDIQQDYCNMPIIRHSVQMRLRYLLMLSLTTKLENTWNIDN